MFLDFSTLNWWLLSLIEGHKIKSSFFFPCMIQFFCWFWKLFLHCIFVPLTEYQWHCNAFQGKKVKCSTSQVKHRLFIGNIPRNWAEDDLKRTVTSIGPGIIKVELLKVSA